MDMKPLIRTGVPLTALALATLAQAGAAARWWGSPIPPEGFAWLAVVLWAVGLWAIGQTAAAALAPRPPAGAVSLSVAPPPPPPPQGRDVPGINRRMHRRFDVSHPVSVELRSMAPVAAAFCNVSEGGACITGVPGIRPGTRVILRFGNLAIPVPCETVGEPEGQLMRVRFDLDGMGKREFVSQLDRLLSSVAPVVRETP